MTSPVPSETNLSSLAGSWTLDPSQTSVSFHTKAMWVLPVKGKLDPIEGSGIVGADGTISGSISFAAASINTNNKKRDDHLRTADFFEVERYPTITFLAISAGWASPGKVELTGDLTIRNEAKPVTLSADVRVADNGAIVSAEFDLDRSVWGVTWAKLGAGLKNHVVIEARFTKS